MQIQSHRKRSRLASKRFRSPPWWPVRCQMYHHHFIGSLAASWKVGLLGYAAKEMVGDISVTSVSLSTLCSCAPYCHAVQKMQSCSLDVKCLAMEFPASEVFGRDSSAEKCQPGTAPDCDPPSPQNLHILVTVLIATGTVVVILTMISRLVSYLPKVLISAFPHPRSPG